MVMARGEIEIDEVRQWAAQRFVEKETRKQLNMEGMVTIPAVRIPSSRAWAVYVHQGGAVTRTSTGPGELQGELAAAE